jgi:putative flippase GtrA
MKIIAYYTALLIVIILVSTFLLTGDADAMTMPQMISVCAVLALYAVALSFIGEGRTADERELQHRYAANRYALLAGTVVLSTGVLVQIFTHTLDYWLLWALLGINVIKIGSLLYSHYRK